ncbi:MAG: hypothetical protein KDM63_13375 [Verrucomicrobiae bacterium]|nr:hypothetical protein [Verrucomicrobiae bacterium]
MRHCVGSYAWEVDGGRYFVYAVRHPHYGRATLGLEAGHERRLAWRVSQLRGPGNREVSQDLRNAVRTWLKDPPVADFDPTHPNLEASQLWLWDTDVGFGVPSAELPTTVGLEARLPHLFREDSREEGESGDDLIDPEGGFDPDWDPYLREDYPPDLAAYQERIARYRPIAEPDRVAAVNYEAAAEHGEAWDEEDDIPF